MLEMYKGKKGLQNLFSWSLFYKEKNMNREFLNIRNMIENHPLIKNKNNKN